MTASLNCAHWLCKCLFKFIFRALTSHRKYGEEYSAESQIKQFELIIILCYIARLCKKERACIIMTESILDYLMDYNTFMKNKEISQNIHIDH